MNNELLSQISEDLQIVKYPTENYNSYTSRVMYSALALWLKTICLDGITQKNQKNYSITKKYFHQRGSKVLNDFIEFFPTSKEWFTEPKKNPIVFIRERLIHSMELLVVNQNNRIYLPTNDIVRISGSFSKIIGVPNNNFTLCSGVALITANNFLSPFPNLSKNIQEFYEDYISTSNFIKNDWNTAKEYFNPHIKTNSLYGSWTTTRPSEHYYLSRSKDKLGVYRYYFEKTKYNRLYSHQIDDSHVKSNMIKRILFYLRHKVDNPVVVEIKKHPTHFILKRWINSFTGEAEVLLQSIGYPVNSLYDTHNWFLPSIMYNDFVEILISQYIKIKEV